jgi:uncharacterized protein with beta-barrel porin domain
MKVIFPFTINPSFAVALEGRGVWVHEFANTTQDVAANFVGIGSSFMTYGPGLSRNMYDMGAALRFSYPREGESFAISYNAVVRTNYVEQVGMLRYRLDF